MGIKKEIEYGLVSERLPNATFKINLESGREIIAFLSGKMRVNNIKVIIGDKVEVELDPYGGRNTNKIIRRFL